MFNYVTNKDANKDNNLSYYLFRKIYLYGLFYGIFCKAIWLLSELTASQS